MRIVRQPENIFPAPHPLADPERPRGRSAAFEDDAFIHVVETASDDGPSPLPSSGIRRVPPLRKGAAVVRNYRMLDEN